MSRLARLLTPLFAIAAMAAPAAAGHASSPAHRAAPRSSGCAASPQARQAREPRSAPISRALAAVIAQVERDTARERGLRARRSVPVTVLSPDAFRRFIQATYDAERGANTDLRATSQPLVLLGELAPHTDLAHMFRAGEANGIIGLYIPARKRMYVIGHPGGLTLFDRFVLAHEYTHALQDQAFGIACVRAYAPGERLHDSDRALAETALVEGDATVSQYVYVGAYYNADEYRRLRLEARDSLFEATEAAVDDTDWGQGAPRLLQAETYFPYDQGSTFDASLLLPTARGYSFAAVNAAFTHPPVSTREILHPDVYLHNPTAPVPDLPQPHPELARGWRQLDSDVLGEFGLQTLLAQGMDPSVAATIASAWRADRYSLYDRGTDFLMAWRLRADSAGHAQALAQALGRYLDGHYNAALPLDSGALTSGVSDATGAIALALRVSGRDVLAVLGSRGSLQPQVWSALTSLAPSGTRQVAWTGTWAGPTPLPAPRLRPAVALGRDGNIYVFGGTDGTDNDYDTTFIYHPRSGAWTHGAPMPAGREGAQAVTLPDGRIVVLGGGTNCHVSQFCNIFDEVDAYNPRSNRWSRLASLGTPRYRLAAAYAHGKVYAIGGWDGDRAVASVEAYDPRANRWRSVASLPRPVEGAAAAADPATGRIYVTGGATLGGMRAEALYNTLYVYDGRLWTTGAPMPQAAMDGAAVRASDGRIYALGGMADGALSTVQVYDPRVRRWSLAAPLPAAAAGLGAVATPGGLVYAVGGNGPSMRVAVYHVATGGRGR